MRVFSSILWDSQGITALFCIFKIKGRSRANTDMQAFLSPSLLFALLAANHHFLVQRVVNKLHCAVCADSKWYLLFQKSGEGTQQKQGWSAQPCGCAASQKPVLGLCRSVWLKNSKVSFITLKSLGCGPCTGPWRAVHLYSSGRKGREGSRFDLPAAKDVCQPPTMDFLTLLCVHTHKGCERFMTLLWFYFNKKSYLSGEGINPGFLGCANKVKGALLIRAIKLLSPAIN